LQGQRAGGGGCVGKITGLRREEEGWRERFDAGAVEGEGEGRAEDARRRWRGNRAECIAADAEGRSRCGYGSSWGMLSIAALAAKEGDTNMPRGATAAAANGAAAAAGVFTAAVDENETAPATAAGRGVPAAEETFSAAAVRFPVN